MDGLQIETIHNDIEPSFHEYTYYCSKCKYYTNEKSDIVKHVSRNKHIELCNETSVDKFKRKIYVCKYCNFKSINRSDITKHSKTKKHEEIIHQNNEYKELTRTTCICGNVYSHYASLVRHKKECIIYKQYEKQKEKEKYQLVPYNNTNASKYTNHSQYSNYIEQYQPRPIPYEVLLALENIEDFYHNPPYASQEAVSKHEEMKCMLEDLIEQTKELKQEMRNEFQRNLEYQEKIEKKMEKIKKLAKQPRMVINQQNTFNLNHFLNVECKNAMNFREYVNKIQVGQRELECLKQKGFVGSFEEIIIQELDEMDQRLRPIHCIDSKRKKFALKEGDIWDKEIYDDSLIYAIDTYSSKQAKEYMKWKKANPDWRKNEEKYEFCMIANSEIYRPYSRFYKESINAKITNNFARLVIDKNKYRNRNSKKKQQLREKSNKYHTSNNSNSESVSSNCSTSSYDSDNHSMSTTNTKNKSIHTKSTRQRKKKPTVITYDTKQLSVVEKIAEIRELNQRIQEIKNKEAQELYKMKKEERKAQGYNSSEISELEMESDSSYSTGDTSDNDTSLYFKYDDTKKIDFSSIYENTSVPHPSYTGMIQSQNYSSDSDTSQS